jgi:tRNA (guanosine-2'-O-)-methyltransferase
MIKYDKDYIAYLEQFVTDRRKEILKRVLEQRTRHFTVVLEDLYQIHNISAVVRSCDIFGIQDVHIIRKNYDAKISHGIAKGAEKWTTFYEYGDTTDAIRKLRKQGYRIIATTPHKASVSLPEFDIEKKAAFFFGVEKDGLSGTVLSQADEFLKIPMFGFTESFNISVAAALILYEVRMKLQQSSIDWHLSAGEQWELYQLWLEKTIKSIDAIKKKYYSGKG